MEAPYNVQAVSLQCHIVQGKEFCQFMQPAITVEKAVECFMLQRGTPMIPKTQYLLWKKQSEDGIGYKDWNDSHEKDRREAGRKDCKLFLMTNPSLS